MSGVVETKTSFTEVIALLREGIQSSATAIEQNAAAPGVVSSLRNSLPFMKQLEQWTQTLPAERMRESLLAMILSVNRILRDAVDAGELDPTVYNASAATPVAPFIAEALIQIGPDFDVSTDCMIVSLEVPKDFHQVWSVETLTAALQRQGVRFGISEQGLKRALQKPDIPVKVAFGKASEAGRNAILEDCLGLICLDGSPTILESGHTDHKRLHLFSNISKGQIIMRKHLAELGEPGMDVYGNEIPAKDGLDVAIPNVPNTEISEDGLVLLSTVDGCCYWENGKLVLVPSLELKSNVDYSTGNVNVDVSVTVNGDVLTGFRVETLQDLIVKGTVEGATLIAKNNAFLDGGVQGKDEAVIRAGKNVIAKFINAATVEAERNLQVRGSVLHCSVRCKRLDAQGENAEIIGGDILAATDVCADILGSDMGVKTLIQLGHDVTEHKNTIQNLEIELPNWQEKLEKYKITKENLLNLKKERGELPEDKVQLLRKVKAGIKRAEDKLLELEERLGQAQDLLEKSGQVVRTIRARKNIYPGVIIEILGRSQRFQIPTGPVTVTLAGDKIELLPYQERIFEGEDDVE